MPLGIEAAGELLEHGQLRGDGALRGAQGRQLGEDGLAAVVDAVLEADPQALLGHVGGGQGGGLVGGDGLGVGRVRAAPRDEGEEAGPLQGQRDLHVVLGVREGGHAEARARGVR